MLLFENKYFIDFFRILRFCMVMNIKVMILFLIWRVYFDILVIRVSIICLMYIENM